MPLTIFSMPSRFASSIVARVNALRGQLVAKGLVGKTITNVIGTLHKALRDAVQDGLIAANPGLRIRSRRWRQAGARRLSQSDALAGAAARRLVRQVER